MFKVNEYFDGKVKSLAFKSMEGQATVGVMAPGSPVLPRATGASIPRR